MKSENQIMTGINTCLLQKFDNLSARISSAEQKWAQYNVTHGPCTGMGSKLMMHCIFKNIYVYEYVCACVCAHVRDEIEKWGEGILQGVRR